VVLGYVATGYGKRREAEVRKDIDQWLEMYPRVHGIFFDEMDYDDAEAGVKYQAAVNKYAHDAGCWPTVGNPGADTPVGPAVETPGGDLRAAQRPGRWLRRLRIEARPHSRAHARRRRGVRRRAGRGGEPPPAQPPAAIRVRGELLENVDPAAAFRAPLFRAKAINLIAHPQSGGRKGHKGRKGPKYLGQFFSSFIRISSAARLYRPLPK
jgi:hypothetical protein